MRIVNLVSYRLPTCYLTSSRLVAHKAPGWGGGGVGVRPYMALTGTCGQIGYGFQPFFVLNGVSISSLFVINGVSLHLNGKSVHLKVVKIVQKDEFVPFLLVLTPEACATTKLGKDSWLNVFRRGLKNLDAVLNRVGKLEISVLNSVRV